MGQPAGGGCLTLCWLPACAGMIMLEASVVVYLLQGHTASGLKVRASWPAGGGRMNDGHC